MLLGSESPNKALHCAVWLMTRLLQSQQPRHKLVAS